MEQKIIEILPAHLRNPLREELKAELRNELIDELKAKGWKGPSEPSKKDETDMDQTIAEWAKQNKSANPNEWSKNY